METIQFIYILILIIQVKCLFNMQSENQLTLTACNINQFKMKTKAVISNGPAQVQVNASSLSLQSKSITLDISLSNGLIRLRELNYSTYIIEKDSVLYSLSLPGNQYESITKFQSLIQKHSQIIDFYSLPPDSLIRQNISTHCPLGPSAQQLGSNNDDNLKSAGKTVGGIFGAIGAICKFDDVNKDLRDTTDRLEENHLGNKESTWGRFKTKCSELNKVVADGLKPISDTCKKTTTDIGNRFDNSNNSFVKGVRQFSKKTQDSLNQGYMTQLQQSQNPNRTTQ